MKSVYSVIVMVILLMQMEYGCIGIIFIQQNMVFLATKQRPQKGVHQTTLCDGYYQLIAFTRKGIKNISKSL